jgi:hypothetical protein
MSSSSKYIIIHFQVFLVIFKDSINTLSSIEIMPYYKILKLFITQFLTLVELILIGIWYCITKL